MNLKAELARRSFLHFITYTKKNYQTGWHHIRLANKLQAFQDGKIKKLMVFMPPQHGKSEQTSRRLPAYLLGKDPTLKIVGCSYSADLARSFNRDVQRIIDDELYQDVFPDTYLNNSNIRTSSKGAYLRNADMFETVNHKGFFKSVGVCGPLSGTPVDIGLIDDPVKDAIEASSPTYQNRVWEWYTQVFLTRLHNESRQLLTMTRWHPDDLAGKILQHDPDGWEILKLEGIREDTIDKEDPRKIGEALWPDRHSLKKLLAFKSANENAFEALYQQNPRGSKGLLVLPNWEVFDNDVAVQESYYGLDFGYANPTALVEVGFNNGKQDAYITEKMYETNLTPHELIARFSRLGIDKYKPMYYDPNREDIAVELRKAGYNARPAKKGKDSVEFGLSLMRQVSLHIDSESPNIQREMKLYRYAQDGSGQSTGIPVKANDHAIDASRYVFIMVVTKPKFGIRRL